LYCILINHVANTSVAKSQTCYLRCPGIQENLSVFIAARSELDK